MPDPENKDQIKGGKVQQKHQPYVEQRKKRSNVKNLIKPWNHEQLDWAFCRSRKRGGKTLEAPPHTHFRAEDRRSVKGCGKTDRRWRVRKQEQGQQNKLPTFRQLQLGNLLRATLRLKPTRDRGRSFLRKQVTGLSSSGDGGGSPWDRTESADGAEIGAGEGNGIRGVAGLHSPFPPSLSFSLPLSFSLSLSRHLEPPSEVFKAYSTGRQEYFQHCFLEKEAMCFPDTKILVA